MPPQTGIASRVAIAREPTHGTWAAPTKGLRFDTCTLEGKYEDQESTALGTGYASATDSDTRRTTFTADGDLTMDARGYGLVELLHMLNGDTPAPTTIVAAAAFGWAFPVGLTMPNGKGLSIQVQKGNVPFSYSGVKVASLELSQEVGQVVKAKWSLDAVKEDTAPGAVVPTVDVTGSTLSALDTIVEVDDVVTLDCVSKWSVTITLPLKVDRRCIGGGMSKREQLAMGMVTVDIAATMEFSTLAQYTRFASATRQKMEFLSTGDVLSGAAKQALNATIPNAIPKTFSAPISGPDLITVDATWKAARTGANPLAQIDYTTSQATL